MYPYSSSVFIKRPPWPLVVIFPPEYVPVHVFGNTEQIRRAPQSVLWVLWNMRSPFANSSFGLEESYATALASDLKVPGAEILVPAKAPYKAVVQSMDCLTLISVVTKACW